MKRKGIAILVIGIIITFFAGVNFITREKVIDLWSPVLGIAMIVVGVGVWLISSEKQTIWFSGTKQNLNY